MLHGLQHGVAERRGLPREIYERLQGERLDEAAGVSQIPDEEAIDLPLFAVIPPDTGQQLHDVPTHLFLLAPREFEQSRSIRPQTLRAVG